MDYEFNMSDKDYMNASLLQLRQYRDKLTNLIEIMERMSKVYNYIEELKMRLTDDPGLISESYIDIEHSLEILKEAENLDSDFSSAVIDIQTQANIITLLAKLKVNENEKEVT